MAFLHYKKFFSIIIFFTNFHFSSHYKRKIVFMQRQFFKKKFIPKYSLKLSILVQNWPIYSPKWHFYENMSTVNAFFYWFPWQIYISRTIYVQIKKIARVIFPHQLNLLKKDHFFLSFLHIYEKPTIFYKNPYTVKMSMVRYQFLYQNSLKTQFWTPKMNIKKIGRFLLTVPLYLKCILKNPNKGGQKNHLHLTN